MAARPPCHAARGNCLFCSPRLRWKRQSDSVNRRPFAGSVLMSTHGPPSDPAQTAASAPAVPETFSHSEHVAGTGPPGGAEPFTLSLGPETAPADALIGQTIDDYEIRGELGCGG